MRCYICNAMTHDTEIYWEEDRQAWSPCPKCVAKVKEAQDFELFDGNTSHAKAAGVVMAFTHMQMETIATSVKLKHSMMRRIHRCRHT